MQMPKYLAKIVVSPTDLEVDEEAVELLLARAAIEVLRARVEQTADEAHAQQVLGRVERAYHCVYRHTQAAACTCTCTCRYW